MCHKNNIRRLAVAALAALAVEGLAAQAPPPQTPVFEVASVKPNTSGNFIRTIGPGPGGRFQVLNNTLRELVAYAYAVDMSRARLQVTGGPAWLDREAFDIDAIAPGGVITPATAREMLKGLLADRFQLKVGVETREVETYDLVVDRGDRRLGPGLRVSSIDCEARRLAARKGGPPPTIPTAPPAQNPATVRPICGLRQNSGVLAGDAVSMIQLAGALAPRSGRIVTDRTGLTGYYDLDLSWTPGQEALPRPGGAPEPVVDSGTPPLFTAIREQLGLRFEGARAPVELVVIQSAERPTPN